MDMKDIRYRAYEIIENTRENDPVGSAVNRILIVCICLNIVSIIAESFENLRGPVALFLRVFEYLSVALFSLEYIVRLWSVADRFPASRFPRLKYVASPMALLDLLAIAPFTCP